MLILKLTFLTNNTLKNYCLLDLRTFCGAKREIVPIAIFIVLALGNGKSVDDTITHGKLFAGVILLIYFSRCNEFFVPEELLSLGIRQI